MTIRRLNYTERLSVEASDVEITLVAGEGHRSSFDASIRLSDYDFPDGASVVVEAYRQSTRMRFSFGEVGNIVRPDDRTLTAFDSINVIFFRVMIVSTSPESEGKLLGLLRRIRLSGDQDEDALRPSLLPIEVVSGLGELPWQLDFEDEPTLQINDQVADGKSLARTPMFISLVFPEILRSILIRILAIDSHNDTDDDTDWRSQWLRFARSLPGVSEVPSLQDDNEDTQNEIDEWAKTAVAGFCSRSRIRSTFLPQTALMDN